jgi:HSP20 family protein
MVTELSPFYGADKSLDRLMDSFFAPLYVSQRRAAFPPLNLSEDNEHIYVECELPGVELADIDITLSESTLTIKGELKAAPGKYYRQERPTGVFQRVVNINTQIKRDEIKATYKDGVLEVVLPKSEELKPKKINIAAE